MTQLPLFDLLNPQSSLWFDDGPRSGRRPRFQGQGRLFESPALAEDDLLRALESGDFEEARQILRNCADDLADSPSACALSNLFSEMPGLGRESMESLARSWDAMARRLEQFRIALAAVNRGMVHAFQSRGELAATLARYPDLLAPAVNALHGRDREGDLLGRELVRDALLRGHEVAPDGVDDPIVRDLLAENEPPRWLASLGVIRHVWHPHRYSAQDLDEWRAVRPEVGSPDDDALAFWSCLCAERSATSKPDIEEARRRMKRLRPEWHQAWLER